MICEVEFGGSTVCLDSALGPASGRDNCGAGLRGDGLGEMILSVLRVLVESKDRGPLLISRRAAMRSTSDLRATLLPAETSDAEGRGDVRIRVLGVPTCVLLPLSDELERPPEEGVLFRCGL